MRCEIWSLGIRDAKNYAIAMSRALGGLVGLVVEVTRVFIGIRKNEKTKKMRNDKRINKECGLMHDGR